MVVARTLMVASLLVLAGCLSGGDDGPPAPGGQNETGAGGTGANETARLDLSWGLTGCQAAVVFFDVPANAVAPHLPDGFAPLPVAQGLVGGGPNPAQGGSFGMELFTCASGQGLNGTVESIVYGSYFAFVDPPDALEHSDVDYHFVKWDTLIPDVPRRHMLQSYGLPAVNGSVAFSTFTQTQSAGDVDGTLVLDGAEHAFTGSSVAPGPDAVSFVEFMQGNGTLVAWKTTAQLVGGLGPGTVDVGAGGLAAEVMGTGSHDGNLLLMTVDFTDGSVTTVEAA